MKIYIAAPYPIREHAVSVMGLLESYGHSVTSRWLKAPDELNDSYAREDLADVEAADMLLALNPPEFENAGTGGRHVELGFALYPIIMLGQLKRVALIGNPSNIFHMLSVIEVYDSLETFIGCVQLERNFERPRDENL